MANSQKFTLSFDAQLNVSQLKGAIGNIQNELNRLQLPSNLTTGLTGTLSKLEKEIRNFEVAASKDLSVKGNFNSFAKIAEKIDSLFKDLQIQAKDLGTNTNLEKFFPESIVQNINKANSAIKDYEATLKRLRSNETRKSTTIRNATIRQSVAESDLQIAKDQLKIQQELQKTNLEQIFKAAKITPEDLFNKESAEKAIQELEKFIKRANEVQNNKGPNGKAYSYADSTKEKYAKQAAELQQLINTYNNMPGAIDNAEAAINNAQKAYDDATEKVNKLTQELELLKSANEQEATKGLDDLWNKLSQLDGVDLTNVTKSLENAKKVIEDYSNTAKGNLSNSINSIRQSIEAETPVIENNTDKVKENVQAYQQFDNQIRDVGAVKSRIQYFFGLNNAINLFRRAVREAFNTIKDLDKAMTETAVVTDFTVADMWSQLPEYTKRANELGVTTQAAYESATLFYQQGLNTQQAAELSTETLKMARIAGLDAAEATDRMTNALRGFNMALDATAAQRVDDVYSQLAAHTASNVDEISTAMTKVASLAHSANMEFETTAAFLAQIIETTRESAETAGTALKTVVARFSEVKKLYGEDQLRGTDEEGQAIDVNRISVALRTAGIDLNKYFLGEVGLDDIFMELASKWDSLTSVQQRYIATQAAGSRQQSRFIALMQDYARTQELVGMAYEANGASAKQFEKTQDSLQSKLARLKNAWNEFLMGLTNNVMVKGFVDVLTNLLNIVNKLTSAFGDGAGSILKWVAAISAFSGIKAAFRGGGILDKVLGSLVNNTTIGNALFKTGALSGATVGGQTTFDQALVNTTGIQKRQSLLFGSGNLFSTWKDKAIQFKQANPGTIYSVEKMGGRNFLTQDTTIPKTLFGALGNKFKGTGAGKLASAGLAKLGFGGAAGAAGVSGAAALAATLGVVTVAAVGAAAAIKAIYDASPQGQLKNAQKLADAMQDVASHAQDTANNLKKAQSSIQDYNSAVNEAATTSDRGEAIQSRNEYIQSLLEQDATYAKYLSSTFENGQLVLTLDEEALANAANRAAEAAVKAAVGSTLAQATVAGRQANVYQSKIDAAGVDLEARTIREYSTEGEYWRVMTDAEYAKYAKLAVDASAANVQMQNYAKQAYAQMIDSKALGDKLADQVTSAMALSFDETDLATANWSFLRSRSHWQQEYLKAYGVEADSNMKTADIARSVRQGQQTNTQQDNIDELTKLLTGADKNVYQKALDAYIGAGASGELNLDENASTFDVFEALGNSLEDLQPLIKALNTNFDDFAKVVKKQNEDNRKIRQQQMYTTSQTLVGKGISTDNLASYLKLEDIEDQQLFSNLISQFDSGYLSDSLVSGILTAIETGDEELTSWLSSLDLSNPIQAFDELSDAAKNGSNSIKQVATALLNSEQASQDFSAANQLSFLTLSDGYDTLSQDLDKFIEENGSISSTNIKELAESHKDLNTLLENGTVSAKALAVALTGIQKGEISALDFNDAILAAINSMDDLNGIVEQTINNLNDFNPGFDENDITGFISKVFDDVNSNIEKGAWGNNTMGNYMRYIFGDFDYTGSLEGYEEAYKSWITNNAKWLENNKDNMFSAWDDFVGENNSRILKSGEQTAEIFEQSGEIIIKANGMTTEQMVNAIAESGELTQIQAEMMIADFKNYSADFAHEMAINDLPNVIQAWADALPEIDGKKIFDEVDITTISKLLGLTTDEVRTAVEDLEGYADQYKSITWTNEKGERTAESIQKVWRDIGLQYQEHLGGANQIGATLFDYDAIKAAYDNLGIPQLFEADFNKIAEVGDSFTATIFGKQTPVAIREGENAGEAYARAYQEAVNQNLADKMSEAVTKAFGEGFEIKINTEDGVGRLEILQKNLDTTNESIDNTQKNATEGINVQVNDTQVSNAKIAVDNLNSSITDARANAEKGINIPVSHGVIQENATGGLVASYAKGSENFHVQPGTALTGEEGPELVWNKQGGYAYITGQEGPEFQNLQPGDRVFNASETKKIFKNSDEKIGSFAKGGEVFPAYSNVKNVEAHGYGDAGKNKDGAGASSGGKEKTPEEWKNELDWLYNLMEDIVELERDQKELEEQYKDYLFDQSKTGRDLYNLLIKQLGNLYTQLDHQTFALEKREQEMREFMDTTNDQDEYLWYNWNDRTLEIDWDAIEAIQDEEQYKHVKELVDEAEAIQDKMDNAEDAITDINNQIQELENIWRDTYIEFENRVIDAIVKSYQKVIDNFSELNDTLNETNNAILDSIQKEISLQRQIRDNTKTEEEIANDEAQLAFLRRDTTGGNDLAALQLEKELANSREQYEDNLVDQAVQKLQDDNQAAAEQREKQIEIMQAQLDYQSENGEFNEYMRTLLETAMGADGELLTNSDLVDLLKTQENWDAMTAVQKDLWEQELWGDFKEVVAFILKDNAEQNGTYITALTAAITGISTTIGSYSQALTKIRDGSGSGSSGGGGGGTTNTTTPPPKGETYDWTIEDERKLQIAKDQLTANNYKGNAIEQVGYAIGSGGNVVELQAKKAAAKNPDPRTLKKNKYATGGLNTSTGLAWLDGTASEPEYVLNARQTDAFLRLADILPAAMSNSTPISNTYGNQNINVSINVDKIDSDYSVDQMVSRVKDKLYEDASYRNVNVLNFFR